MVTLKSDSLLREAGPAPGSYNAANRHSLFMTIVSGHIEITLGENVYTIPPCDVEQFRAMVESACLIARSQYDPYS